MISQPAPPHPASCGWTPFSLKEKRQAVIFHAFTRGLNPAAALKPSGIEWLGDVPEHWSAGGVGGLRVALGNWAGDFRRGLGGERQFELVEQELEVFFGP